MSTETQQQDFHLCHSIRVSRTSNLVAQNLSLLFQKYGNKKNNSLSRH
jgi:hypothetical protein